ncbi:MAG: hypothetical protein HUJ80_02575, partial [Firmicutes bacterium]|nr:hypothetical protein [Bacillota bacterium]
MERKKLISRIDRTNPTPEQAAAIKHHEEQGYKITNMKETLLHSVVSFVSLEEGTYAVDKALREKIGERAGILFGYAISSGNDCPICGNYFKWVLETKLGVKDFATFEFTDEETELINFAAALVKDPNHVPDEVYEPLQARYDEETLVNLITIAVLTLANNYWNNIVGTPIDDYLYEGNFVDREMDIQKAVKEK